MTVLVTGGAGYIGSHTVHALVDAGESVVVIDNFRSFTTARGGRVKQQTKRLGQDKGHAAELAAFVEAVAVTGVPPVPEDELIEASLATIAVLESLRDGATITL